MAATLIKGAEVAAQIRAELKEEVAELKAKHNLVPGLVTILVGQDPGSVSYVTAKQKTSHELGFYSIQDNQEPDITEAALLGLLDLQALRYHRLLRHLRLPAEQPDSVPLAARVLAMADHRSHPEKRRGRA